MRILTKKIKNKYKNKNSKKKKINIKQKINLHELNLLMKAGADNSLDITENTIIKLYVKKYKEDGTPDDSYDETTFEIIDFEPMSSDDQSQSGGLKIYGSKAKPTELEVYLELNNEEGKVIYLEFDKFFNSNDKKTYQFFELNIDDSLIKIENKLNINEYILAEKTNDSGSKDTSPVENEKIESLLDYKELDISDVEIKTIDKNIIKENKILLRKIKIIKKSLDKILNITPPPKYITKSKKPQETNYFVIIRKTIDSKKIYLYVENEPFNLADIRDTEIFYIEKNNKGIEDFKEKINYFNLKDLLLELTQLILYKVKISNLIESNLNADIDPEDEAANVPAELGLPKSQVKSPANGPPKVVVEYESEDEEEQSLREYSDKAIKDLLDKEDKAAKIDLEEPGNKIKKIMFKNSFVAKLFMTLDSIFHLKEHYKNIMEKFTNFNTIILEKLKMNSNLVLLNIQLSLNNLPPPEQEDIILVKSRIFFSVYNQNKEKYNYFSKIDITNYSHVKSLYNKELEKLMSGTSDGDGGDGDGGNNQPSSKPNFAIAEDDNIRAILIDMFNQEKFLDRILLFLKTTSAN